MSPSAAIGVVATRDSAGRFLLVTVAEGDEPTALQVTSPEFACLEMYAHPSGVLVDAPVFQTASQWGQTVLFGIEVVPSATYEVRTDCGVLSEPQPLTTAKWGDADRDGRISIFDLFCVLDGFRGNFNDCTLEDVDLTGADDVPDGAIDIGDIFAVLDAFRGLAYPGPLPCDGP